MATWPFRTRIRMLLIKRLLPLLLLLAIAVALQASGATRYLAPQGLGERLAAVDSFVAGHHWSALAAFVLVFMTMTAAFIPAALVLTLVGGFLFGPWIGGGATVVGATLGAIITFLAVRTAAGVWIERRFVQRHDKVKAVMEAVEKDAFFYVLALRLAPVFPFSMVNIAAGLSKAPLRPYTLATLIGAIPTSLIYSRLGAGLGQALTHGEDISGTVLRDPGVLWSLAALACLALAPLFLRGRLGARG